MRIYVRQNTTKISGYSYVLSSISRVCLIRNRQCLCGFLTIWVSFYARGWRTSCSLRDSEGRPTNGHEEKFWKISHDKDSPADLRAKHNFLAGAAVIHRELFVYSRIANCQLVAS
jgi:hypothetical protein